jgi:hypothetical protein
MASKVIGGHSGVAKSAHAIAVKCWDHAKTALTSNILAGITYIQIGAQISRRPSIANFSWHCESRDSLVAAVNHALSAGIHIVAGAGNSHMTVFLFPSHGE